MKSLHSITHGPIPCWLFFVSPIPTCLPFIIPGNLSPQCTELEIMSVWWEKTRLIIVKPLFSAFKNNLNELKKLMNEIRISKLVNSQVIKKVNCRNYFVFHTSKKLMRSPGHKAKKVNISWKLGKSGCLFFLLLKIKKLLPTQSNMFQNYV